MILSSQALISSTSWRKTYFVGNDETNIFFFGRFFFDFLTFPVANIRFYNIESESIAVRTQFKIDVADMCIRVAALAWTHFLYQAGSHVEV